LLGGVVGVLIGAIGVQILGATPVIRGLLEPDISIGLLTTSVAIAVAVGVISGLYPAWRSSRLTPSQALQG
jgi:putative ABC transport system permease protein